MQLTNSLTLRSNDAGDLVVTKGDQPLGRHCVTGRLFSRRATARRSGRDVSRWGEPSGCGEPGFNPHQHVCQCGGDPLWHRVVIC